MNVDYRGGFIDVDVRNEFTQVSFILRKGGSSNLVGSVNNRSKDYERGVIEFVRQAKRAIDVQRTNERVKGERQARMPELLDRALQV